MKIEVVRPLVYLDISISEELIGRVVLELYQDLAPKASENFRQLCKGDESDNNGNRVTYKNSYIHHVIKNFLIQGGDIVNCLSTRSYGNDMVGTGGISVIEGGKPYDDENLGEPIDAPFKLCMANGGHPNNNTSQFFITTGPQPHLNGKHTVFGKVLHGKAIVRHMERVRTNNRNIPFEEDKIVIENCGEWDSSLGIPMYVACYDQIGGDIFEEYPEDDDHFDQESTSAAYNAASIIKESGASLFKEGRKREAFLKYKKSLRYVMEFIPDMDNEPKYCPKYTNLKKKLYLNLALSALQTNNWKEARKYSTFLLELDNVTKEEKSKGYYRRGLSSFHLKRKHEALEDLMRARELVSEDLMIEKALQNVQEAIKEEDEKRKKQYSRFFA